MAIRPTSRRACTIVLALLALASQSACQDRALKLVVTPQAPPKTIPVTLENVALSQPINERNQMPPQQVHITYWGTPSQMLVSFVSGTPKVTNSAPTGLPELAGSRPVVQVRRGGSEKYLAPVTGFSVAYSQAANYEGYNTTEYPFLNMGYVSGVQSHVLLKGLKPGTKYFYRVAASPKGPWTKEYHFTTLKAARNFPMNLGYMADLGISFNASTAVERMLGTKPDMLINLGDLSYADTYLPDGQETKGPKGLKYMITYQPTWDKFGNMLEKVAAYVPHMTTPGNHEIEFQPNGTVYAAYNTRYPVPQTPNPVAQAKPTALPNAGQAPPTTNMYYSFDIPGVAHMVFITTYIPDDPQTTNTSQYRWLEADLKAVDRKKTPWVIVNTHAPFVSSWEGSFKNAECMRITYEPLLFKYGADLFINGHTHAYERTLPVYQYRKNPCGMMHVTIGNGGKPGVPDEEGKGGALDDVAIEEVYTRSSCTNTTEWQERVRGNPTLFNHACVTKQPELGGFCWNKQPAFSAVRDAAFGMYNLQIMNSTHAVWSYFRNQDKPGAAKDRVILNRSVPKSCVAAR